jgi:hypothetical protein
MVRPVWKIYIAMILIGASLVLGLTHIIIFGNPQDLFFYLALDVVFVPIQVLLVTLIIERLMAEREKQVLLHKMNMVIGAFFGEMGARLLKDINGFCPELPELSQKLAVSSDWTPKKYKSAVRLVSGREFKLEPDVGCFKSLRDFLLSKRGFMLALLENPNLLEHENFTDLLWSVSHLTEELEARPGFDSLPASDIAHLKSDTRRAHGNLIREWLAYMKHLQSAYPYIFSLAVRTNPFNPQSSPVVKEG